MSSHWRALPCCSCKGTVLWHLGNTRQHWMASPRGGGRSPAGRGEYRVAPGAVLYSPCSLLGSSLKSQHGHLLSSLLGQQLLWQSRQGRLWEGVARTFQSSWCLLFYWLSHHPENVFPFIISSCFISVTHRVWAVRILPCILDLAIIVHKQCYLEGGLDPGFQIMLTWLVIIVTRDSAVTSGQSSCHPAFHKRVNLRGLCWLPPGSQADRLQGLPY